VRRLPFLLAACGILVVGLAGCGGSGGAKNGITITLGRSGGLVPYEITIKPTGEVTTKGQPPAEPTALTSAQEEKVSKLVHDTFNALESKQCPGTFPDEVTYSITAMGKTVTVRGDCEPGFTKLRDELTTDLGLNA
jgi:hypothetical protein